MRGERLGAGQVEVRNEVRNLGEIEISDSTRGPATQNLSLPQYSVMIVSNDSPFAKPLGGTLLRERKPPKGGFLIQWNRSL